MTSTPNDITDMLTENLEQPQTHHLTELDSEIQASDKEAFIEEVCLDSTYTLDTSDIVTTTDPNYP